MIYFFINPFKCKNMKINETIGIDVSKLSIGAFIYSVKLHKSFKNNSQGFSSMLKWIGENSVFPFFLAYVLESKTAVSGSGSVS
jgi:hypothetical protein